MEPANVGTFFSRNGKLNCARVPGAMPAAFWAVMRSIQASQILASIDSDWRSIRNGPGSKPAEAICHTPPIDHLLREWTMSVENTLTTVIDRKQRGPI